MPERQWGFTTSSQDKSKHWTINTYKLIYVRQTVPWVFHVTAEALEGQRGMANYGIILVVQYVTLFTTGFD